MVTIGATGGIVRPRKDVISAVENAELSDDLHEVAGNDVPVVDDVEGASPIG